MKIIKVKNSKIWATGCSNVISIPKNYEINGLIDKNKRYNVYLIESNKLISDDKIENHILSSVKPRTKEETRAYIENLIKEDKNDN